MGSVFELSILFLSWIGYLGLHSLLASTRVKRWVEEEFPSYKRYRLFYSLLSVITLLPIVWLMATLKTGSAFEKTETLKYFGFILGSWGMFIISLAFRQVSVAAFLGLRKDEGQSLVRSGILSKIRHPIYAGTIVLMMGMVLAVSSWAVVVATIAIFVYLPFGIHWEEQKLIAEFGDTYRQYKREVPALLPKVF